MMCEKFLSDKNAFTSCVVYEASLWFLSLYTPGAISFILKFLTFTGPGIITILSAPKCSELKAPGKKASLFSPDGNVWLENLTFLRYNCFILIVFPKIAAGVVVSSIRLASKQS